MEIGRASAGRIPEAGARPGLVRWLADDPSSPVKVWYLAGDLAFSNLLQFSGLGPLGFAEGVAGDYGGYRLFLLTYDDPEMAADRFSSAVERMTPENPASSDPGVARFEDRNGELIELELVQRFILVTDGATDDDGETIREGLRNRLATVMDE